MRADTSAIHHFGTAQEQQAASLGSVAAALAAAQGLLAGDALGPVGAGFVTALSDAVARQADAIARLGDRAAAAGVTARGTAAAYQASENAAGQALSGLGA